MAWKQQFFVFVALSGLYLGFLALVLPAQVQLFNLLSIGTVFVLFSLSSLIMTSGKNDPETNVQHFMLGTTVQMLVALFYVLIIRFTVADHFRAMCFHFIGLFFAFLIVQAIFMVRKVRGS